MNILSLFLYPIKSCGGISVNSIDLDLLGPIDDRRLVIVDEKGVFRSQRRTPKMAQIHASIDRSALDGPTLSVQSLGVTTLKVPLTYGNSSLLPDHKEVHIKIHEDICVGTDLGDKYAKWFSDFLGCPCRLVRQHFNQPRIRPSTALDRNICVSYADGYPLLITTVESLSDLNDRIRRDIGNLIPMNRFRPNIVLSGCEKAYAEDSWKHLKIDNVVLEAANNCVRCVITTTDQITGERCGGEPLRTLKTYRDFGKGSEFGRNFAITNTGTIRIGQAVKIID